ncbi:MAG: sigma-70 family RNA polymerase sigma factor [Bacteroidales bacterium]|jgi:RNA polymerase sigma-70 factor (ECF subfamily)|nr:sigma-70 family RNA polymerase sigma factor [Bacteroidales bacterium]
MDTTGFNQLMKHLRPKMYRFALAFVRRSDEAEDVVQDVSESLWNRRAELDKVQNIEAYAMNSVKNKCLDSLRATAHRTVELNEAAQTAHEQTPYRMTEQKDMADMVRKLAAQLPVQQQMALRLRDIEGYELNEIATIMDLNEGAVRANLSRARQKIRELLMVNG